MRSKLAYTTTSPDRVHRRACTRMHRAAARVATKQEPATADTATGSTTTHRDRDGSGGCTSECA